MVDKEEVTKVTEAEKEVVKNDLKTEMTEVVKADAAKAAEVVKTDAAKTAEAVKTEKITEVPAADAKEPETKKTGYLSEINGIEVDFELQYREQETDMKDIATRVTEDYTKRGNDASGIKLIQVYLKPTDFTAYYVINNSYEGKIPLF